MPETRTTTPADRNGHPVTAGDTVARHAGPLAHFRVVEVNAKGTRAMLTPVSDPAAWPPVVAELAELEVVEPIRVGNPERSDPDHPAHPRNRRG